MWSGTGSKGPMLGRICSNAGVSRWRTGRVTWPKGWGVSGACGVKRPWVLPELMKFRRLQPVVGAAPGLRKPNSADSKRRQKASKNPGVT